MRRLIEVEVHQLVQCAQHVLFRLLVLMEIQDVLLLPHHRSELAGVVFGDVRLRGVHEGHRERKIQEVEALVGAKPLEYLVLGELFVEVRVVQNVEVVCLHHAEVKLIGLD